MSLIASVNPLVCIAHYYQFPHQRNPIEMTRIGYCYAFHLISGGKGAVRCEGKSYTVKKGDMIFFKPGLPHSFYTSSDQLLSTYNLYCDLWQDTPTEVKPPLVWDEDDFKAERMTHIVPCPELDDLPVVNPLQQYEAMQTMFTHAVMKSHHKGEYTQQITGSIISAFILELIQLKQIYRPIDYRMAEIIETMDREGVHTRYPYKQLFAKYGLGKTHIHELFKQATGMSPKAYLTQAIMKRARASLWESNRSITDIAMDLHYSSIHHFTKQFTLYHGVSPTAFRRRKM